MGRPPRNRSGPARPPSECRCLCGSLLARLVEEGVELRCRRCKRSHVVPLAGGTPGIGDRAFEVGS